MMNDIVEVYKTMKIIKILKCYVDTYVLVLPYLTIFLIKHMYIYTYIYIVIPKRFCSHYNTAINSIFK